MRQTIQILAWVVGIWTLLKSLLLLDENLTVSNWLYWTLFYATVLGLAILVILYTRRVTK